MPSEVTSQTDTAVLSANINIYTGRKTRDDKAGEDALRKFVKRKAVQRHTAYFSLFIPHSEFSKEQKKGFNLIPGSMELVFFNFFHFRYLLISPREQHK